MIDKSKSDRVIKFIERYCTHTAGVWAGDPFKLLDWQLDLISKFYGTVKEDGTRQYRFCYLEIPKKNGKTELGAALALYHLLADGEPGAEVYSAAAEKEQAGLVYKAAAIMVSNSPELQRMVAEKRLVPLDSRKRMVYPKTSSYYQVLSSEAYSKHGINPSAVLVDELHAQPNHELWNVLTSGTDYARAQQAVIVLTTAGIFDPQSVWWKVRNHAIKVRDGAIEDQAFLPILYIADIDADPSDEEVWKKNNPSLGQIFTLQKIRDDYNRIKHDPIELNNFKRFRLNIPAQSEIQWIMPEKWNACGGDLPDFAGRKCYAGLDLSSTMDLTALVYAFEPEEEVGVFDLLCRFFIPKDNVLDRVKRDRVPYDVWIEQGHIIATAGNSVDQNAIIQTLIADAKQFDIKELAIDPWNSAKIIQDLQEHGFEDGGAFSERILIEFRQGYRTMSPATKDFTRLIYEQRINHADNPVLRWNAHNVMLDIDPAENIKPSKSKSTDRIDGVVAAIMATSRALYNETESDDISITMI